MLVSLTVTLIMMGAAVTIFGLIGNSVSGSRAMIETSERLRSARNQLQQDLSGVTASMRPPLEPESNQGFFEYAEGPRSDSIPVTLALPWPAWVSMLGDLDDAVMMTVRSDGDPFVGRFSQKRALQMGETADGMDGNGSYKIQPVAIESTVAEIVWFVVGNGRVIGDSNLRYGTLYRRVLLVSPVLPDFDVRTAVLDKIPNNIVGTDYFDSFDISAHVSTSGTSMIANTLSDLTKRENRFAHEFTGALSGFPFRTLFYSATPPSSPKTSLSPFTAASGRLGEDVMMSNVLTFDVRAFDKYAVLRQASTGAVLSPSDVGYNAAAAMSVTGAFVDLNYGSYVNGGVSPPTWFSGQPNSKSQLVNEPTYNTWSTHYEHDTIAQNGGTADLGADGLDNDSNNVVDDPGEFDTLPPYPVQPNWVGQDPRVLRGIQIKLRVYEPDSQQIREVTVVQDFLPQ